MLKQVFTGLEMAQPEKVIAEISCPIRFIDN